MTPGADGGALTAPWFLVREIALKVAGDSITPGAWAMRDDLEVLGLGGLWEADVGAPVGDEAWRPWADKASAVASMRDAAWTQRIEDHLLARPGARGDDWDRLLIDPVTMGFVSHHGANPVALAAMTRLHDDMVLEPAGTERLVAVDLMDARHDGAMEPFLLLGVDLGGVSWECDRLELTDGQLPETLAIAIEGLPLRRVVSHPLLDRHDVTVVGWDEPNLRIRHGGPIRRLLDWTPNGDWL